MFITIYNMMVERCALFIIQIFNLDSLSPILHY